MTAVTSPATTTTNAEKAAAAWGADLPDWVAALAAEADRTSGAKAAARIGMSGAVVSQVLANKYPGSLAAVEERVRTTITAETVECPALGQMDRATCQEWRGKAKDYQPTSALRGRMHDACNACSRHKE